MLRNSTALAILAGIVVSGPAHAELTISTAATQNVTCSGGVCAPTATDAVLNVTDLESLLASGPTIVTTTGSGVEASSLFIRNALTWTSANTLGLEAMKSIIINRHVSVAGTADLNLTTKQGHKEANLLFGEHGSVTFANLASVLAINGHTYFLANTISGLAAAIAQNPSGYFVLANDYNATKDGTYASAPIPGLQGTLDGLGNKISHLRVNDPTLGNGVGFIGEIDKGVVTHLRLEEEKILATANTTATGGLVGISHLSYIFDVHTAGSVVGDVATGGLAGFNDGGIIQRSSSSASVHSYGQSTGGLVGLNEGSIHKSFANGKVIATLGTQEEAIAGGLVGTSDYGLSEGEITNSYATGNITISAGDSLAGGFLGYNGTHCLVWRSYSTGKVVGRTGGGFLGEDNSGTFGAILDDYWDTVTSGTDNGVQGGNESGITGLTTKQFQSGLPQGFRAKKWREEQNVNRGLPYLISNPPPE